MINYWKMSNFSIRSVWYAYVDHKSYLADSLFVESHVHVTFKEEMMKADSQYRIVFCKVLKKDTAKFEEALDKLKNKMFLLWVNCIKIMASGSLMRLEADSRAV